MSKLWIARFLLIFFFTCVDDLICEFVYHRKQETLWSLLRVTIHLGSMTVVKGAMNVSVLAIVPDGTDSIPDKVNTGLTLPTVRLRAGILLQSFWTRNIYNSVIIYFFNMRLTDAWRSKKAPGAFTFPTFQRIMGNGSQLSSSNMYYTCINFIFKSLRISKNRILHGSHFILRTE